MGSNSPGKRKTRLQKKGTKKIQLNDMDRGKESEKEKAAIELEHVLGMTVYTTSALSCEPRTGMVAYPAGCVLVLLDSVKYKQVGTLHAPRKSITATKFSPDGRYILTGECGLQPAVRVWELSRMAEVATLRGHSVGIASVAFSPCMHEIIVVGDAQDMMISVWAWPSKIMKALNKFADEIYATAISEDSRYFVTVGNRHVKFYYIDNLRVMPKADTSCPIPLPTRCGMLDNLKENCFCDVICGRGSSNAYIFVIAVSGILCQINRNRLLERWVNVNMETACCLTADDNNVFVGGVQGLVRIFRALDLQIILTLPRPHSLGLDISQVTTSCIEEPSEDSYSQEDDEEEKDKGLRYPATRALSYDPVHENLTVVYDDHSIYIWARDMKAEDEDDEWFHFSKKYSSIYHRGCVWDLTTYPVAPEADTDEGALGGALPPGALISVSADCTLRAWDVCSKICEESVLKRNCLSPECLKIVYEDKMDVGKKSRDKSRQQCNKSRDGPAGSFVRHGKQSFSVVAVCPDGLHIATGNRHGRVCIYDTNSMNVITTMLAHEAEVTALGYSVTKRYKVLASGSRDRMIHVMDASRGYQLLTTLDDHSSTITAINFTYIARCLLMVTSSLDMSVLVRAYLDSDVFAFKPVRAIVEKKSVMDFTIHPWSGLMALACQDRLVRIYSIMSSVENNSFRGCPAYGGQLIKIQIDPSGQYLLTACSNKTINLLQFHTGVLLSTFNGHAESITCIKFSHNMKHVISSAVDGCIFLWRLPESVTYCVKREMAEMGRLTRGMVLGEKWKKSKFLNGVRAVDILSDASFKLLSDVSVDLKPACHGEEMGMEKEEKGKVELHSLNDLEAQPSETYQLCAVSASKIDIDNELNKWRPSPSEVATAPSCITDRDDGNLRVLRNPSQTSQISQLYPTDIRKPTSFGSTSEAWLSACHERRRIFKLEARSIKKILAMMRLVTDAMEKDLASPDYLMYSSSNLASHNKLSECCSGPDQTKAVPGSVEEHTGVMVSSSLRSLPRDGDSSNKPALYPEDHSNCQSHQGMTSQKHQLDQPKELTEMLSQQRQQQTQLVASNIMGCLQENSGRSDENSLQHHPDAHTNQPQRTSCQIRSQDTTIPSHAVTNRPQETLTIKVSADSLSGETTSLTFLNELEGLNYASAVHCISEVLEQRQKMYKSSSTSLLCQSFLDGYNPRGLDAVSQIADRLDSDDSDEGDKHFYLNSGKPSATTIAGTSFAEEFGSHKGKVLASKQEDIENKEDEDIALKFRSDFDCAASCPSITDNCNIAFLGSEANLLMDNNKNEVFHTYSYDNVFSYVAGSEEGNKYKAEENLTGCQGNGLTDDGENQVASQRNKSPQSRNLSESQTREEKNSCKASIHTSSEAKDYSPKNVTATGLDGYLNFLYQECNNAEHQAGTEHSSFSPDRNTLNYDSSGNCANPVESCSLQGPMGGDDEGNITIRGSGDADCTDECDDTATVAYDWDLEDLALLPSSLMYCQGRSDTMDWDNSGHDNSNGHSTASTSATDQLEGMSSWTCCCVGSQCADVLTCASEGNRDYSDV